MESSILLKNKKKLKKFLWTQQGSNPRPAVSDASTLPTRPAGHTAWEQKKSTYIHTSIDFGGKCQGRRFSPPQVGGALVCRLNAVVSI
jgi:hypothetical protein